MYICSKSEKTTTQALPTKCSYAGCHTRWCGLESHLFVNALSASGERQVVNNKYAWLENETMSKAMNAVTCLSDARVAKFGPKVGSRRTTKF